MMVLVNQDIEAIEEPFGYPEMKNIDTCLGLDGIVGRHENEYYVCLAGSNEWKDWKINCELFPDRSGFHAGFNKSFLDGKKQILKALFPELSSSDLTDKYCLTGIANEFRDKKLSLNIGGFSNGAAVAVVASIFFYELEFPVNLVTWGQPKVLTTYQLKDAERLGSYIRVVHPFDPVTCVPIGLPHAGKVSRKFWWGWGHNLNKYLERSIILD